MIRIPIFVYETLKKREIQKQALGHTKKAIPAVLHDYHEIHVDYRGEDWPTLKKLLGASVKGEILEVSPQEIKKLDNWEDHYHRKSVHTDRGYAWTYIVSV